MNNMNLCATLSTQPKINIDKLLGATVINKGETLCIPINLKAYDATEMKYSCQNNNIVQIRCLFKLPDGSIYSYPVFNEEDNPEANIIKGALNTQYFGIDNLDSDVLIFTLKYSDMKNWPEASFDDPIKFEIAFKIDTKDIYEEQKLDTVIVEPQGIVVINPSIYGEYLENNKGAF